MTRQGVPYGAIFCRAKDADRSIEWQADYFAACLLMPQKAVVEAFDRTFEPDRLEVFNIRETFLSSPQVFDICVHIWPHIAGAVCEAGNFSNVSRQAMIIRLQELGLVVNQTSKAMGWTRSLIAA